MATRTQLYTLPDLRERAAREFAKTIGVVGGSGGWIRYAGTGRTICQGWATYYACKARVAILDAITTDYTAFKSFSEMVDAKNYRPTLRIESWKLALLAMEFNAERVRMYGTSRAADECAYTPDWITTSYRCETQEHARAEKARREAAVKAEQDRVAAENEAKKRAFEVVVEGAPLVPGKPAGKATRRTIRTRAVTIVEAIQAAQYQLREPAAAYWFRMDRVVSAKELS